MVTEKIDSNGFDMSNYLTSQKQEFLNSPVINPFNTLC